MVGDRQADRAKAAADDEIARAFREKYFQPLDPRVRRAMDAIQ